LVASPAQAQQKAQDKKTQIEALKAQIKQLRESEKPALKQIDVKYEHILKYLDPKQVRGQLEEGVKVLRHVHEVISEGDFDYGGHRKAAQESVRAAEHQLEHAAHHHESWEARKRAAEDLRHAHEDLSKALRFSLEKYGANPTNVPQGEPESRAAANQQLVGAIGQIELTHHLLTAVDHEIRDWKEARKHLNEQREQEKHALKEQIKSTVKQLEAQIKMIEKQK